MIVSFLPVSNIFGRVGFVIAERILYIPRLDEITRKLQICQRFIVWLSVDVIEMHQTV